MCRPVQPQQLGPIREIPQVGGLYHRYERIAAWPDSTAFSAPNSCTLTLCPAHKAPVCSWRSST
jgi:hypothetical protein